MISYTFLDQVTDMNDVCQIERLFKLNNIPFVKSSLTNNEYTVFFNSKLSATQEQTLFQIVENFVPTPDMRGKVVHTILPLPVKINSNYYEYVCSWNYPGYFNQVLECIYILSSTTSSTYNIRLYDATNNKVIIETIFSNTALKNNQICINPNLLPSNMCSFEIHVKVNSTDAEAYIQNITYIGS